MRVLAVGCHPDDLEINAFGALARCVQRGDEVIICGVANGSGGSMVLGPKESAALRIREATAAAKVIGAKDYINLGVDDLTIDSRDPELIDRMVDVIRMTKPDFIITQMADDYQRDHSEVYNLVFDASFRATIPNYKTQYPVHPIIAPIFSMEGSSGMRFQPTDYVDITRTVDLKLEALACHASQIEWLKAHVGKDLLSSTKAAAIYYGKLSCCPFAEGFVRCNHVLRMDTYRYLPEGK